MPKRRANGEGSIFPRKDKNDKITMWAAEYTDNIGKRRTVYGKTQQLVKEKLKSAIRESEKGIDMDKSRIYFVEWIQEWLDVYVKPTVKKSTYALYYRNMNDYVIPAFPNVLLKDLRADMLQKHFNILAVDGKIRMIKSPDTDCMVKQSGGLGYSMLNRVKKLLVAALRQAVDNGIVLQNPALKIKLPQFDKPEKRILAVDEQKRLESVLLSGESPACIALYLILYTGLRVGEVIGLQETDIDFEEMELYVRRSISRIEIPETGKTEVVIGNTKTTKGQRVIPLPPFVCELLKEYTEKVKEAREIAKRQKNGDSEVKKMSTEEKYLFFTVFGKPYESVFLRRVLDRSLKEANVNHVTVHALRHTFTTRCVEAGFDIKSLAEILGHTDVKMTLNVYTHSLAEQKRKNMNKLTQLHSHKDGVPDN